PIDGLLTLANKRRMVTAYDDRPNGSQVWVALHFLFCSLKLFQDAVRRYATDLRINRTEVAVLPHYDLPRRAREHGPSGHRDLWDNDAHIQTEHGAQVLND